MGCLTALVGFGLLFSAVVPVVRLEMRYRSAEKRIQEEVGQMSVDRTVEVSGLLVPLIRELGLPPAAQNVDVTVAPGLTRRFSVTLRYADTVRIVNWSWVIRRRIDAQTP